VATGLDAVLTLHARDAMKGRARARFKKDRGRRIQDADELTYRSIHWAALPSSAFWMAICVIAVASVARPGPSRFFGGVE